MDWQSHPNTKCVLENLHDLQRKWSLLESKFPGVAETINDLIEKEDKDNGA